MERLRGQTGFKIYGFRRLGVRSEVGIGVNNHIFYSSGFG